MRRYDAIRVRTLRWTAADDLAALAADGGNIPPGNMRPSRPGDDPGRLCRCPIPTLARFVAKVYVY